MNKKLLISLSTLSTIAMVAPVLIITSCAENTVVEVKDLTITATATPKLTQQDITALKGTELPAQFAALQKLFGGPGLTQDNQANFKVSVNETNQIVTLTANTGFTINTKPLFASNKYIVEETTPPVETTNLVISAKLSPTLTIAEENTLKGSGSNTDKWSILEKFFGGTGFVPANQDKFTVAVGGDKKVTLNAISGYTINNAKTFVSNAYTISTTPPPAVTELKITAITTSATLTATEVTALTGSDATAKFNSLKKLFQGNDLTETNLSKFKVAVNTSTRIVTLTAEANYTFADANKILNSTAYTNATIDQNLNITAKQNPKLTDAQFDFLSSGSESQKQTILGILFNPINANNYKNFTFKVDRNNFIVTLTAANGFIFGSSKTLQSNKITIENPIVNLVITAKATAPTLTGEQIVNLTSTTPATKLTALKLLFDGGGLITGNLANFTVSVNTTNRIVTLTPNKGFTIGGQNKLDSKPYTVAADVVLPVKQKIAPNLTAQQAADIEDPSKQEAILGVLFESISGNFNKFTVVVNKSAKIVTITAKQGFIFSSNRKSLTSYPWGIRG
ncbi:MAG: hypothetical protein ACRDAW_01990 [Metamycoplasmataceae bacterium]